MIKVYSREKVRDPHKIQDHRMSAQWVLHLLAKVFKNRDTITVKVRLIDRSILAFSAKLKVLAADSTGHWS